MPAAEKTMTVGDDRKLKLDFSRTVWRDILAEYEENGSLPTADQVPPELDWPRINYDGGGSMVNYLTHAEMMSLGLQHTSEYRFPKNGASQLHWNIHNGLVARKADYNAARAAEEAAYNEIKALVERAAAEAPGTEVSERTQRHYAGEDRKELNAENKAHAKNCGYVERVPTEIQKDPEWAASQNKALEKPLNPPSKEHRVDKMSSCQCELGWGLVMVIHYLAYLNAKSAADAIAMSEAIEALRNIVQSRVYQTREAAAAMRVRAKESDSKTRRGRDLLSFPRRSACTSSSTRAWTSRSACRSAPCARPRPRRRRRPSRARGSETAWATTSSASRCATASRSPRRPTRRRGTCRVPRSTRCSTAAGPRSRRSATA